MPSAQQTQSWLCEVAQIPTGSESSHGVIGAPAQPHRSAVRATSNPSLYTAASRQSVSQAVHYAPVPERVSITIEWVGKSGEWVGKSGEWVGKSGSG